MIHRDDIEDEKRWLKEMLLLARQVPGIKNHYQPSRNEQLVKDFVDGEGIFASDNQ